jgi:1,5-anhydro-D-fructose reductase (1,5-anhydro-D-mannitol-forming)
MVQSPNVESHTKEYDTMIRVAVLSHWHVHAKDYSKQAVEHPDTEIVAVWDDLPERGRAAAQQWGGQFEESLSAVLARDDIDGVIVVTPTNEHRDVMTAAARAGKHIFTEKVLASTLREANEILGAVEQAGVKLTVSLPRLNAGYTQAIQAILAEGQLGQLTEVRTRLSHGGALRTPENPSGWLPEHFYNLEQCGGGALIDLGCHPMYLARLFLGLPETVSAHFGYVTGRAVEDNAVAVLSYPNGALGIVEAGFVNRCSPFTIEVHGTEGSLLYGTPESVLQLRSAKVAAADTQWRASTELPAERPSAFHQWVDHIQHGTIATENIQSALDLTRLMEAATLSARAGQPVRLDSLAG